MTGYGALRGRLQVDRGSFRLDVELAVEPGEVLAVLGTNGAGKSTLVRTVAGEVGLADGRLLLGDRVLDDPPAGTWLAPEHRRVGLVPQDLLLFDHLSVRENVAFGLRAKGSKKAAARQVAQGWLDRFEVGELADRRPRDLSGGQAQRVALARALATEPEALLLDEPLAALDATTRTAVRRELRAWLDDFAGATVLVTHDPLDALLVADHVLVLEDGRATQSGTLREVAARPRTPYVAHLLGTNLVAGTGHGTSVAVEGAEVGLQVAEPCAGPVFATFPPSAITVHRTEPHGSARNRWPAPVLGIDLLGHHVRLELAGPIPLHAEITPSALADLDISVGEEVWVAVKASEVAVYPR